MKRENLKMLVGLLALLRALKWNYWNSHWMVKGGPYYADHLLFQRLYEEQIDEQIDTLAEKITAYDGDILGSQIMLDAFNRFLNLNKDIENPFERGLKMENHVQRALKSVYSDLQKSGELSLGMDDFLMATASERETVIYLLKQRTRS